MVGFATAFAVVSAALVGSTPPYEGPVLLAVDSPPVVHRVFSFVDVAVLIIATCLILLMAKNDVFVGKTVLAILLAVCIYVWLVIRFIAQRKTGRRPR